ncbi:hypothetical protein F53441_8532 [Fusarium austroafricanum]|uniref:Uncharacterized protein n=1 Tax=Fusarium austroafricanum TaxID=2364996 RepID=A0A8H4KCQ3_9HYPO|nr:hypothetical protein F53441_8532 [Fusarium austroafricanum]
MCFIKLIGKAVMQKVLACLGRTEAQDPEAGGSQDLELQPNIAPAYRAHTPEIPLSNREIYQDRNEVEVWTLDPKAEASGAAQYDAYAASRAARAGDVANATDVAAATDVPPAGSSEVPEIRVQEAKTDDKPV